MIDLRVRMFGNYVEVFLFPQGSSWLHVGTDQPFKSISIGGANQVWAITRDGAVFYRGSVSPQNPAGLLEMKVNLWVGLKPEKQ